MKVKNILWLLFLLILIVGLYAISSSYVKNNATAVSTILQGNLFLGITISIVLAILDVLLFPVILIPFIPAISNLYGPIFGPILIIIGWVFGSAIAFYIARRYGIKVVNRIFSKKSLCEIREVMPKEKDVFWFIVFARIFLPMDIGSYGLGIFSDVKFGTYILATIVGIIPTSLFLSYLVNLSLAMEIIVFIAVLVIVFLVWQRYSIKARKTCETQ